MRAVMLSLLVLAGAASAETSDLEALSLADRTPVASTRAGDWRFFGEGALGRVTRRADNNSIASQRLSLDFSYDGAIAPLWRATLADRLDVTWRDDFQGRRHINTLKEAYLSWQPARERLIDIGRVNARNGVALGYNPTDFFRAGALRSVVSVDPASLRSNRLGSVMLRGQTLWAEGGLTALYSPDLAGRSSMAPFSVDLGATNHRNRWLVSVSQRVFGDINPQWLLYVEEGAPPQLGFNLTALLNDATVGYVEWTGGRGRSLRSQVANGPDDTVFRSRLATGLTYTTGSRQSFTLEYDYNGAGLDQAAWDALGRGSPADYARYREYAARLQDLPTRQGVFTSVTWQDAVLHGLDLSAFARFNLADHSRMVWIETRYRWERTELALQWQVSSGRSVSEYGALSPQQTVQMVATRFFE